MDYKNEKPTAVLNNLTERLALVPDNATWRLHVNEVANELLALAAGDDPIWGIIATRRVHKRDRPEVQEVGHYVGRGSRRPITYRQALETVALFTSRGAHWIEPFTCRIVPFEKAEEARRVYEVELANARKELARREELGQELVQLARSEMSEEQVAEALA